MIDAWIRRTVFWTLDTIKGGKTKKHYNNIKAIMEGKCNPHETMTALLQHAIDTVPFYRSIQEPTLSNFPVTNKKIYMSDYESFQSTQFLGQSLRMVSTSGSTGTPLKAGQDANKGLRNNADCLYFHKRCGWNLGDKFIFIRAWASKYKRTNFKNFKQNVVPLDSVNFGIKEKEQWRQYLKKHRSVKMILGYASILQLLVNYLIEKEDTSEMFHINAIISESETLTINTKKKLEKMFNCPVIDRYSDEELGILACTRPFENVYELNCASYYFELLKLDSDEPTEPGEVGRVVVTDLYNYAMPFIRYDVGDLALSDERDRDNLTVFHSLQGRIADMISDTHGNHLSSVSIDGYLDEFYKVKQWQFVQTDKYQYLLKVNCKQGTYSQDDFKNKLKKCLGADADITVEYVDSIPTAANGKYKSVINNYQKIQNIFMVQK